jgi:hypothetical protein
MPTFRPRGEQSVRADGSFLLRGLERSSLVWLRGRAWRSSARSARICDRRKEAALGPNGSVNFVQRGSPAVRVIRPTGVLLVIYGFGDASGSGFGSSFTHASGIVYRVGVWGYDVNGEWSNYRELQNLVEVVEVETAEGAFAGYRVVSVH